MRTAGQWSLVPGDPRENGHSGQHRQLCYLLPKSYPHRRSSLVSGAKFTRRILAKVLHGAFLAEAFYFSINQGPRYVPRKPCRDGLTYFAPRTSLQQRGMQGRCPDPHPGEWFEQGQPRRRKRLGHTKRHCENDYLLPGLLRCSVWLVLRRQRRASVFALTENLCHIRGFRDRFLVRDPLGHMSLFSLV
jgi:hypothetical protein